MTIESFKIYERGVIMNNEHGPAEKEKNIMNERTMNMYNE